MEIKPLKPSSLSHNSWLLTVSLSRFDFKFGIADTNLEGDDGNFSITVKMEISVCLEKSIPNFKVRMEVSAALKFGGVSYSLIPIQLNPMELGCMEL